MARYLQFRPTREQRPYPPRSSQPCPGCVSQAPAGFAAGPRFAALGADSNSPVTFIAAAIAISLGLVFAIRTASKS